MLHVSGRENVSVAVLFSGWIELSTVWATGTSCINMKYLQLVIKVPELKFYLELINGYSCLVN